MTCVTWTTTPIFPVSEEYQSEKGAFNMFTLWHVLCGRIPEKKPLGERGTNRRWIAMLVEELSLDLYVHVSDE